MSELQLPGPGVPLPRPTVISKPFWDGCAEERLMFQRCTHCGSAVFNPAPMCRHCGEAELVWEESAGRGTIYSWTVAWRPQHPAFPTPYAAAIIDLAEGYQMLANVGHCRSEDLAVGMAVRVFFVDVGEGMRLPCFAPISAALG